jgi:hypothetical protein
MSHPRRTSALTVLVIAIAVVIGMAWISMRPARSSATVRVTLVFQPRDDAQLHAAAAKSTTRGEGASSDCGRADELWPCPPTRRRT